MRHRRNVASWLFGLALAGGLALGWAHPRAAAADAPADPSASGIAASGVAASGIVIADGMTPSPRPGLGLEASLGVRWDFVTSRGLDAFVRTPGMPESALAASWRVAGSESAGFAVGGEWNHGEVAATARGTDASLKMDRLSLSLEGRRTLARPLVGFVRLAPAMIRVSARLAEASAPGDPYGGGGGVLSQAYWQPAVDASAGLALRFAQVTGLHSPMFGFWLTAEAGYGASASHDLTLGTGVSGVAGRSDEPVSLGTLALGGAFMRFAAALSF